MAALESADGLRNLVGEWCFLRENPYDAKSLREVHVEERGTRVWRAWFERKRTRPGTPSAI